ncbi:MAG: plasmid replication/partition related protein [Comamonas sp.]|nr:plasmid replication/partition related protein [Comamonas sp.]
MTADITILPELQAYIDPLTPDEFDALERSILAEGCRDALVLWGNVLVDGHNRYRICQQHGVPFQTVQNTAFQSLEDVQLWMIDQHLGRRSISDFQRGVLALRKREIITQRRAAAAAAVQAAQTHRSPEDSTAPWEGETDPAVAQTLAQLPKVPDLALDTREALARAARLSPSQVKQIETIQQQAAPEVVSAVKTGELSLSAAATLARLPLPEQQAAAEQGAQGLKEAVKRVRQAQKTARAEKAATATPAQAAAPAAEGADNAAPADVQTLQARIATLEAENQRLRLQVQTLQGLLAEQN